jgi:hypothetical protein
MEAMLVFDWETVLKAIDRGCSVVEEGPNVRVPPPPVLPPAATRVPQAATSTALRCPPLPPSPPTCPPLGMGSMMAAPCVCVVPCLCAVITRRPGAYRVTLS